MQAKSCLRPALFWLFVMVLESPVRYTRYVHASSDDTKGGGVLGLRDCHSDTSVASFVTVLVMYWWKFALGCTRGTSAMRLAMSVPRGCPPNAVPAPPNAPAPPWGRASAEGVGRVMDLRERERGVGTGSVEPSAAVVAVAESCGWGFWRKL